MQLARDLWRRFLQED